MKGTVNLGGKDVGMTANAASPYFYKQIFHEDFLRESQKDDFDSEIFQKMGFVMAMQDEKTTSEILALSVNDYIEWLLQFDAMDVLDKVTEIAEIYMSQKKTTATPKNGAV